MNAEKSPGVEFFTPTDLPFIVCPSGTRLAQHNVGDKLIRSGLTE